MGEMGESIFKSQQDSGHSRTPGNVFVMGLQPQTKSGCGAQQGGQPLNSSRAWTRRHWGDAEGRWRLAARR